MRALVQALKDLKKELGWVVLYGILATLAMTALVYIGWSYNEVLASDTDLRAFRSRGIQFLDTKDVTVNALRDRREHEQTKVTPTAERYLTEALSPEGNAGAYVILYNAPGLDRYERVIVLLGAYADLTPFGTTPTDSMVFAVSPDLDAPSRSKVAVNGTTYPLTRAPESMRVFHPMWTLDSESGQLDNTLFVFAHSLSDARSAFPQIGAPGQGIRDLLFRFILVKPTEQDVAIMRKALMDGADTYVGVRSIDDYLRLTEPGGIRVHRLLLVFFSLTTIALIASTIGSILRTLRRNLPEYAIHNVFGASYDHLTARMFFLTILCQLIPLAASMTFFATTGLFAIPGLLLAPLVATGIACLGAAVGRAELRRHEGP